MWLFYTLMAACLWGVGQIFVKKGFKETSPLFNNIYSSTLGFLIYIPFSLAHGVHFDRILQIAPLTAVAALFFLLYYYVIGRGQLSLTGTVIGISPLVAVILSFIFLHETPNIYQKLAIIVILTGTTFIALPDKLTVFKKVKLNWLWWAILAVLLTGTAEFLIKLLMNQSDLYTYLFTFGMISFPLSIITAFFDKKGRKLPPLILKNYFSSLIGVAMVEFGFFTYNLAISEGFISLVSPLSSIYVGITAVLAWFVLKEKINKKQFLGISLSVLGVILIGIT